MGYSTSFYHGYGLRVQRPEDWYEKNDDQTVEEVLIALGGPVYGLMAGDYDADWDWLFIRRKDVNTEIELGTYVKVDPYDPSDVQYLDWDWYLTDTAMKLGLEIKDGPSWFFVPDYS